MVVEMEPEGYSFRSCFQKNAENQKVCFECTGARGFHVSPRREAPKVLQKYLQKTQGFQ